MNAYKHLIDAKQKKRAFDIVSPHDFQMSVGQSIDPHIILTHPTVSLYCLDHANERALFVETAADVDLLQAPFYFIAQYEAAQNVITIPYETLHALAQTVTIDPQQIVFFYSTGRCGSTLVSQVMNAVPAVASYSEPDVFSQLVMMHTAGHANEKQLTTLLHDTVMVMAANAHTQSYQHIAFKFRSYILAVSTLLYQAIPTAKSIFMYRNGLTWAHSFSRAFGMTDEQLDARMQEGVFRYMIAKVNDHLTTHDTIRWVEYLAYMWVEAMENGRKLQQQGTAVASASFEALQETPHAVIESLLTACGLPMPPADQLAHILAGDSQAGTMGARSKPVPARQLSDAELAELAHIIHNLNRELASGL